MYSVLLIVVNACLLLLNANASPIRTTTVYDALQITPLPLPAESHPVQFLSLSSKLCKDNVRSAGCEPPARLPEKNEPEQQSEDHLVISSKLCKDNFRSAGCEPPARLTKRGEPAEPTLLCGKHCNIKAGECVCHHLNSEWPRIWRYPSRTISRRPEDKPAPTPTPTETSPTGHPHDLTRTFIWRAPSSLFGKFEGKPTSTPTPRETSSTGHPHDLTRTFIWRAPSSLFGKFEGKPTSTPTPRETSSTGHPHDLTRTFIWRAPSSLLRKFEGEAASIPTPTETLSNGDRQILEIIAVEAAGPHHTLSPRDNEEELRKRLQPRRPCRKGQACYKWQNTFPPPAEAELVSKTDIGHPTLSHRDDEAEPTLTQTSTAIQSPTPTTTMAPCDPLESECPENDRQYHWFGPPVHHPFGPAPAQHEKGIHKSPEKLCGANDQECRKNLHFPPTKSEEEERDVDIVIPSAASEVTIPICTLPPFLC